MISGKGFVLDNWTQSITANILICEKSTTYTFIIFWETSVFKNRRLK